MRREKKAGIKRCDIDIQKETHIQYVNYIGRGTKVTRDFFIAHFGTSPIAVCAHSRAPSTARNTRTPEYCSRNSGSRNAWYVSTSGSECSANGGKMCGCTLELRARLYCMAILAHKGVTRCQDFGLPLY